MQDEKQLKWAQFLSIPSPLVAEIAADTFLDILVVDLQHSPIDIRTSLEMIRAIQGMGKEAYVRLSGDVPNEITKVLDAGVDGIICPMLDSVDEVKAFLAHSLYPPKGNRSFGPQRAALIKDYSTMESANKQHQRYVMIETTGAATDIEAILRIPDLDGILIGPYDLSLNMGLADLGDVSNPDLNALIKRATDLSKQYHKNIAIFIGDVAQLNYLKPIEFDWISLATEAMHLKVRYAQLEEKINQI